MGGHHFGYYYTGWEGGVPLEGDWPEIIDRTARQATIEAKRSMS